MTIPPNNNPYINGYHSFEKPSGEQPKEIKETSTKITRTSITVFGSSGKTSIPFLNSFPPSVFTGSVKRSIPFRGRSNFPPDLSNPRV